MESNHVYDNYEIGGCRRCNEDEKDDRQYVETCDEAAAQFWTLYGHIEGEGIEAIAEFGSRPAAERMFFRITGEPFTGSYRACPRLRLMHAAPGLLAALEGTLYALDENREGSGPSKQTTIANALAAIAEATAACPPWVSGEPDIDALLANRREIAVTWCVDDVRGIRPDLNEDQCWEVLENVKRKHDADYGINWTTLEVWAEDLFGRAPATAASEA